MILQCDKNALSTYIHCIFNTTQIYMSSNITQYNIIVNQLFRKKAMTLKTKHCSKSMKHSYICNVLVSVMIMS